MILAGVYNIVVTLILTFTHTGELYYIEQYNSSPYPSPYLKAGAFYEISGKSEVKMETFFRFINMFPLPLWLAMMFAPKHRLTIRAAHSSSLFGLAALNYLMALLNGTSEEQGFPDFTSLHGLGKALGTREGALGAWSHMAALDLFTGAWIYRQCRRLNAPDWVRIPVLFFTLMTGPFGLFLFLFWRLIGAGEDEAFAAGS